MDDQTNTAASPDLGVIADRLSQATQSLADALQSINANFESLHAKVDRIVAAIENDAQQEKADDPEAPDTKIADLQKANHDLKAQAARARRKTLSPMVTTLLAKEGVEGDALIEAPIVEKALAGLSIEQRIAVKAELARAGILM